MARIVTVYLGSRRLPRMVDMSMIRWWRMSAAMAGLGHDVDIATNEWRWFLGRRPRHIGPKLRMVPLTGIDWGRYDVVKTLFHLGFRTLCQHGGRDHPYVISKLGSVVAAENRDGILFQGDIRRRLFATQEEIASKSRYVTVLSPQAGELWKEMFGQTGNVLLVPLTHVFPHRGPTPTVETVGRYACFPVTSTTLDRSRRPTRSSPTNSTSSVASCHREEFASSFRDAATPRGLTGVP